MQTGDRSRSPVVRLAVVLHGRLPTWDHGSNGTVCGRTGCRRSSLAGILRFCHRSIWQHVLIPNRRDSKQADVFVHSWHPELAAQYTQLYGPVASLHEPLPVSLNAASIAAASLRRALTLVTTAAPGYDLVFVTRQDLVFYSTPHIWARHTPQRRLLVLPEWCAQAPLTASSPSMSLGASLPKSAKRAADAACATSGSRDIAIESVGGPSTAQLLHQPSLQGTAAVVRGWWFAATTEVALALVTETSQFAAAAGLP